MSTYERYDETSAHYDATRLPVGADIIADALSACGAALDEVRLLDAGCGSGNYSLALADAVGRIDAVDRSAGMLAAAQSKLDGRAASRRVHLHRASIEDLPFAGETFDGAMINQVLHHLESGDASFSGHRRVLAEVFRVLRPGGIAVVNVCSHDQLRKGFWFYGLVPQALGSALGRCIPLDALIDMLGECGFAAADPVVPFDLVMQGPAYFDGRGPLRAEWRDGDSIWALAGGDELRAALQRVRALDAAGRLDAHVRQRDALRPGVGQFTFIAAHKPA